MAIKHRIVINVSNRDGCKANVFKGADVKLPAAFKVLFGDFTHVYLLKLGQTVESVDVKEFKEGGKVMNRMGECAMEFERLKHCEEVLVDISETMMKILSRMDEMVEVKSELKTERNTKKKAKVKNISFAEIMDTVVNKLSGLNLARYVNFLVETAVYYAVRDVMRRAVEIVIELFTYETEMWVVIFTAYGLIWIGILLKYTKKKYF